ncbi:helix-turn-helix domain-containing protein [Thermoproteota archaeon]
MIHKDTRDKDKNVSFKNEKSIIDLEDIFLKSSDHQLYQHILKEVEKPLIEKVLERTLGNQLKAAELLGINRNTLRAKIKKFGIHVDRWKQ